MSQMDRWDIKVEPSVDVKWTQIEREGAVVWGLGFVAVKYRLEKNLKLRAQPLY